MNRHLVGAALVDRSEAIDAAVSQVDQMVADEKERLLIVELKAATVGLRDSELAQRAAHERYRKALEAFNAHVAPLGKP